MYLRKLGLIISVVSGTIAGPAYSFAGNNFTVSVLGDCIAHGETSSTGGNAGSAYLAIDVEGLPYHAGGAVWSQNNITNPGPNITISSLANCGFSQISLLQQQGAVASQTYVTQSAMFVRFRAIPPGVGSVLSDIDVTMNSTGNVTVTITPVPVGPVGLTVAQTQQQIAGFMKARGRQVINAQPDVIGFLFGSASSQFNADVTRGNGTFNFATSGENNVWARVQGSWSDYGTFKDEYFFGAVGAHTNLSPNALLGVMLEVDNMSQTQGAASTDGTGYLVGPYLVAKIPNQPLFFSARLLAGKTDNETKNGGSTDYFDTKRLLATVKVAGQVDLGSTVMTPSLSATHLRDKQEVYVSGGGATIGAQRVDITEVEAGLDFARPFSLPSGELMVTGGISGIWSDSDGTGFGSTALPAYDGGRARVTLGASQTMRNGMTLNAETFYDGIGASGYESYGLSLGLEAQF